jgi:pilus assembly protein CpaE
MCQEVSGQSIVVVDDDRVIQRMVGGYLERNGYRVRLANNGIDALKLIRQELPDLVITDSRMPELNGIELTARLRGSFRTASLPVIMFSALTQVEDALVGYSAGADEYLPKPFELALLGAKVQALLRRASPQSPDVARGKIVVFAHAKGGVGTTSIVINLAVLLGETSPGLIGLLDLDVEFGDAATLLNLQPSHTLADLRAARADDVADDQFDRFLTDGGRVKLVVGADAPEKSGLVTLPAIQLAIDQLSRQCDYVLIDAPASFAERTLAAIDASDLVYLVTSASLPALRATRDCLAMLVKLRMPEGRVRVVLNHATERPMEIDSAAEILGRRPDYSIARSAKLDDAVNTRRPLVTTEPGDPFVTDLRTLADGIVTELRTVRGGIVSSIRRD